jgi:hypothetical protein
MLEPDPSDSAEGPADPLEELTGMTGGPPPARPDDPVLARLLPDGYGPGGAGEPPDEEPSAEAAAEELDAAEFRRLTERDVRTGKIADADAVLADVPESGGSVTLDEQGAERWLRAINDVRLALGTRLGVTEDSSDDFLGLPAEDPRAAAYGVYVWLSLLQESLIAALVG